jgi:hypothetical protein
MKPRLRDLPPLSPDPSWRCDCGAPLNSHQRCIVSGYYPRNCLATPDGRDGDGVKGWVVRIVQEGVRDMRRDYFEFTRRVEP